MRCSECGYQNDDTVKICTKCGTKLSASSSSSSPSQPPNPQSGGGGGMKTVKGSSSNQPAWDAQLGKPAGSGDYHQCPECGHYPLQQPVSSASPCPNCQSVGIKQDNAASKTPSSGAKTSKLESIDFGAESKKVTLTDIRSEEPVTFKGSEINLTRENLDPSNSSISTNHANLVFKNGTLHITDKSSNKATFTQVQGETPVPSGSKIIIGNNIYRVDY